MLTPDDWSRDTRCEEPRCHSRPQSRSALITSYAVSHAQRGRALESTMHKRSLQPSEFTQGMPNVIWHKNASRNYSFI